MKKIKKGDIVSRISYNRDILFIVDRIISTNKIKIAILKGLTIRITADAPIEDLIIAQREAIKENIKYWEDKISDRLVKVFKSNLNSDDRLKKQNNFGKILHLDGDRKYSEKSLKYYKSLGLNAIVKNIQERNQPKFIIQLLERYRPDVVVITGHDGMIKNGIGFNDINNYRNSIYFINCVKSARSWEKENKEISIFAGACQSYYEALINAGANFASSPDRILIDFIDPLIVAEKIASTDERRFIKIKDIENDLRDGQHGVSGIGSKGRKKSL